MSPACTRPFYPRQRTGEVLANQLSDLVAETDEEVSEATMSEVSRLSRESVAPPIRMELALHPWSAYFVLPNLRARHAGVLRSRSTVSGDARGPARSDWGIAARSRDRRAARRSALRPGSRVRFGPARVPNGLDWPAIGAVAPLKGIGFTVAIFISVLAFDDEALQEQAKLAILRRVGNRWPDRNRIAAAAPPTQRLPQRLRPSTGAGGSS